MRTLRLVPDGPTLNAVIGRGARGTGGEFALNVVKDRKNTAKLVPLVWTVSGFEYDYLMAFWRRATMKGTLPFLIDLPLQDHTMTTHKACFIPGTLTITPRSPVLFAIVAQVMAVPYATS